MQKKMNMIIAGIALILIIITVVVLMNEKTGERIRGKGETSLMTACVLVACIFQDNYRIVGA